MSKFTSVIKYEGDNKTLIWKHPQEDFDSYTQLVVHESQEAIFMMNGEALDLFGPGRHTLENQNIPLVRKFLNYTTETITPFHCEIYFINRTEQMGIKWGTDTKVQFIEPQYQFPIQIGACGELSLRIDDSRKVLVNLVGTESTFGQKELMDYFRPFLMTKIKSYIPKIIKEEKINIFQIDEHLNDFSIALQQALLPDFASYGISLERFFVTTVLKPEGEDSYEKFKNLYFRQYADIAEAKLRQQVGIIDQQTEAEKIIIESQAIAKKRLQEGYTYQQERGFDVAETVAAKESSSQFTSMEIGLDNVTRIGSEVDRILDGAVDGALTKIESKASESIVCPSCGKVVARGRFCSECGKEL
ncbi:SPFH domain-containing protein [Emergencia sp.]|uniref:SPFH domain-containing protein n=1 Tax=Emergencia sp. TaxID=1926557 RepID=UPI003AF034BC